jgi:hypothetical protein
MYLKRVFKEDGELDYISLANTGKTPNQNFSVKLVTEMLGKGLMEIHEDELIFHVHPEDLHYEIKRTPGRYCLHCSEKLADDASGALARLHVAQNHAGQESPDPSNPAGYVSLNHFECVLNPEQHKKFKIQEPARAPHFPMKEEEE